MRLPALQSTLLPLPLLPPPPQLLRSLLSFLLHSHPQLSSLLPTSLLALNQEFIGADSDAPLRPGDELAFIQPISGG